ncbi:hypothetical protein ZIOFF_040048 [Zingiber officinale]|uniref:DUF7075 domain-containing protein n=1 Tax=Zingiber officinale TaxID=94328 RepID=A0A8J5G5P0_ZINOF|nr:hypothetical protein ZIOFF_040048 [Zingiber officinale]
MQRELSSCKTNGMQVASMHSHALHGMANSTMLIQCHVTSFRLHEPLPVELPLRAGRSPVPKSHARHGSQHLPLVDLHRHWQGRRRQGLPLLLRLRAHKDSASVIDQRQFWTDWSEWEKKDKLALHFIKDTLSLAGIKDTLIMRKFGDVEPDNYWNTQLWPNLARDTSPDALLATLGDKIDNGRRLYIATDEPYTSFFDPLKDKYTTYFLDDFKDLWNGTSEWYQETKELNGGVAVEFDGYMRVEVDTEVFLRGKKQLETFNDLTSDCKDGINTYPAAS